MRDSARRATAFHEAGHVVAQWRNGLKLKTATIVPTVDASGSAESENPLRGIKLDIDGSDRARLRAEKWITVMLAGPTAQRLHNPRSWRHYHGASDRKVAVDLALNLNGSGEAASAYLNWLEIVTRQMIAGSWPSVERVAGALLEHGTLAGPELLAAIMPKRDRTAVIRAIDEHGNSQEILVNINSGR
jgi:hypothetical protein